MRCLHHALIALSFAAAACSGVKVDSEHDPAADFARFKTFAQAATSATEAPADGAKSHATFAAEIDAEIERALTAKGLKSAAPDAADLLVRHHLRLETKVEFNDPYYAYKAVETYEEGTLIIDLLERETNRRVWRGTGMTRLREELTRGEREAHIREAVDAILAQYPPEASSSAR